MSRKLPTVYVQVPRLSQLKFPISNAPMVNMTGCSVHDLKYTHASQLELVNNLKQQEARLQREGHPYDADGFAQVLKIMEARSENVQRQLIRTQTITFPTQVSHSRAPLPRHATADFIKDSRSPYYIEVHKILRDIFGLSSFRPNQLYAILATLSGIDVLMLKPTGGGKSLCYQLPALCERGKTHGVTLVIQPLTALMLEQVRSLQQMSIDAELITHHMSALEQAHVLARMTGVGTQPKIVYVSPERMSPTCGAGLLASLDCLYAKKRLARFAVDEAHLIHMWGVFRDAYGLLDVLRSRYPGVPIIALTASATLADQEHICRSLLLSPDHLLLKESLNRSNLRYIVLPRPGRHFPTVVAERIRKHYHQQAGIIYCIGREKCESVAADLRGLGIKAAPYHAYMVESEKQAVLKNWNKGLLHVICATIALGLGIDKRDVRFVIHFGHPSSPTAYYQETGRAGRDGLRADCILYYSWKDQQLPFYRIQNAVNLKEEERQRQLHDLEEIIRYSINDTDCRHGLILRHFDEPFDQENCNGMCDNCTANGRVTTLDMTDDATEFVQLLLDMRAASLGSSSRVTRGQLIKVFMGRKLDGKEHPKFSKLTGYGVGKRRLDIELVKRMFDELTAMQVISQKHERSGGEYTAQYSYPGPNLYAILNPREPFIIKYRAKILQKRGRKPVQVSTPPRKRRHIDSAEAEKSRSSQEEDEDEDIPDDEGVGDDEEDEDSEIESGPEHDGSEEEDSDAMEETDHADSDTGTGVEVTSTSTSVALRPTLRRSTRNLKVNATRKVDTVALPARWRQLEVFDEDCDTNAPRALRSSLGLARVGDGPSPLSPEKRKR